MKRLATSGLAMALALSGCVTTQSAPRSALPVGARYVALGSSFAAGAGIGPIKAGTPARCGRTVNNYPTLLSHHLDLELEDQTCGGATTANVLGPWNELPAQIDAVTADTRLVTVTIGGNDLGYVSGLIGGSCRGGVPFGSSPCFPNRAPSERDYARVEEQLRAIAAQVARRAPRATLVFVQYLMLVPRAPCDEARLPSDDAAKSREIGRRLAEITTRVARYSGSLLLPVDKMSRDHTACSAQPWSVGMTPGQDPNKGVVPWHPTAAGHDAIARALAARLRG